MRTPLLRTQQLVWLAILNIIVIAIMQSFGPSLKPFSIIEFEFAGTPEQAQWMVTTWRENDVLDSVYFLIGFDYLFMITYSAFLWLACRTVAGGLPERMQATIHSIAWLQLLAALLDALENWALYRMVTGFENPLWPTLSVSCATPKFIIVVVGITTALVGGLFQLMTKKKTI